MTVSAARRKDHVRATLVQMVNAVGDAPRLDCRFRPDDPSFDSVLPTTWREMLDADLIEDRGRHDFVITPFGWITGLRISGLLAGEDCRSRAQKIVRALKGRVKGRQDIHDELVDIRTLASELALPIGWLANAMEARLIEKVFPKDRMRVRYEKLLVRIPPTFGTDPIEID
ncbi:MAG: hypothetical protein KJ066_00120 [Acidobacteria bacterium]|nr:hypothetical protein [Acidobacteriota bacterium]